MSTENSKRPERSAVDEQAADWLARLDRGLLPTEQDDYLQWLRENPGHAAAVARHESSLQRMMQLSNWRPRYGVEPNPDLFAPQPRRRKWFVPAGVAAAAALALGTFAFLRNPEPVRTASAPKSYLHVPERLGLPDGSQVELKDGSRVTVLYSADTRRVRLTGGEASFTVCKDPARPFVVEAGAVAVRAVGTVFNVRLGGDAIEVLVTEGKVQLEGLEGKPAVDRPAASPSSAEQPMVLAGERATISLSLADSRPHVAQLTPGEVEEALAWKEPRLQFSETPLADAVVEFNRQNRRQLVLAAPELGRLPIGGTFRPHNIEAFVHLLEITLGIQAENMGSDIIILNKGR